VGDDDVTVLMWRNENAEKYRRKQSGACMQPYMVRWQALVDLINGRNSTGFSMCFLVSSFVVFFLR
jgi:hypothetical protein